MGSSVTIDKAGRVVLPKKVRDELRLEPGDTLELEWDGACVMLHPVRSSSPLHKKRGVWVYRSGRKLPAAVTDKVLADRGMSVTDRIGGNSLKAFLDTSVLVAAFYEEHQHHEASLDLFLRFEKNEACCAAHSLAEVYSTLTGMPGRDRVNGDEALLFLANIRERLTLVALNEEEVVQAIESGAAASVMGGGIYESLIARCALKADAASVYTWNLKNFQRLGGVLGERVRTP